jgi:hypothetical protein
VGYGVAVQGDLNTVYAAQQAHRRMLLSASVFEPDGLLTRGALFPRGALSGDAYIGDVVIIILIHNRKFVLLSEGPRRLARADSMCDELLIPTNDKNQSWNTDVEFWGEALLMVRKELSHMV